MDLLECVLGHLLKVDAPGRGALREPLLNPLELLASLHSPLKRGATGHDHLPVPPKGGRHPLESGVAAWDCHRTSIDL